MIYWFKARRLNSIAALAIALYALMVALFLDSAIELPFATGGGDMLLMMLAPLPICSALVLCLRSRLDAADALPVRRVWAFDMAAVAVLLLLAVVIGQVCSVLLDSRAAGEASRNTVFLAACTLAVLPWLKERAIVVPVATVMVTPLLGRGYGGEPRWWAILLQPAADPTALAGCAAACTAAAIAMASHGRRLHVTG
ncbi:hypothetical protein [Streptomyces gobiensis]|uniref:hypothetical protein n=1 Tax=Streptomyces gobiensis TaxID=2875706 RepID=UPI001E54CB04|nr:hypothetical protein [Streptomyces gobiensis]UGY92828.1 hypothetical protein test1122_14705 [Streptomyces gobiensis]